MKRCNRCLLEQPLENFLKHKLTFDGLTGHCKVCDKKRRLSTRYEVTIIERKCNHCQKIKSADYFAKNPRYIGGLHTWCKECSNLTRREKNYHIQSNLNKREKIRSDPEYRNYINEQKRLNGRLNFKSTMLSNARKRAISKNLEFDLEIADIIIPDLCPILKVPFIIGQGKDYEFTPSIDRIDNSKGYTKNNIQIITKKANSMKNSALKEELILFAEWVFKTFKIN